jgi:chemotaxis protein methyltransferase CheR
MAVEIIVPQKTFDIEVQLLIDAIHRRYHHDFRQYAKASIKRRVRSAMVQFNCSTVSQLQDRILHDEGFFALVVDTLTVQVSDMFRDPEYFLALRQQVIPVLRTYPSLRIWVAGCSAGEEAYSLAILLDEEGLLERTTIYATDINSQALRIAASGIYNIERVSKFTLNYQKSGGKTSLSDYFTAAYDQAIFSKNLKKHIVFSDHSLATDHVFAEMQLVSCRNVLIYFERELQDRAMGLFREALCRRGFLGLGSKESLRFTAHAAAFQAIDAPNRLFQKAGDA